MAKDQIIESHIAQSKAKIKRVAPDTVDAERHIDRTQQALERSRALLDRSRDPLELTTPTEDIAAGMVEDRPDAPQAKRAAQKAKLKGRR